MIKSTVVIGPLDAPEPKNVSDEARCVESSNEGEKIYHWQARKQQPFGMTEPLMWGKRPSSEMGKPKPGRDKRS